MVNVEGFCTCQAQCSSLLCKEQCSSLSIKGPGAARPWTLTSDLAGPPGQGGQKAADSRNSSNEIKLLLKEISYLQPPLQIRCAPSSASPKSPEGKRGADMKETIFVFLWLSFQKQVFIVLFLVFVLFLNSISH